MGHPVHNVWLWARPDGTTYLEYMADSETYYLSQDFSTVGTGYTALHCVTLESLPA
ncbi:hypothetical protein AB0C87_24835 [Actinomadura sp. NPDC048021]|uniref:hypothetical protein n=1 Tax=Actinomadura sp. NPDC048021 TaxID=3155385 RepID=UPI0034079925